MNTIGNNIRTRRHDLDMTQSGLAKLVGVTQASISDYESDHVTPRLDTIIKLAHALRVPIHEIDPSRRNPSEASIERHTEAERREHDVIARLEADGNRLQHIERKLDVLTRRLERQAAAEEQLPADVGDYAIPVRTCGVYGLAQCKAEGHLWEDVIPDSDEEVEQVFVPPQLAHRRRLAAFVATGDSMTGKVEEGDYVYFDPDERVEDGNIVLAKFDDTVVCKEIYFDPDGDAVTLSSSKPGVRPLVLTRDELDWAYRVVGRARIDAL